MSYSKVKRVKITVKKIAIHEDLIQEYEKPMDNACMMKLEDTFISEDALMPKGFCESAWMNLSPFVFALASGAEDIYDGWMKDKRTAMISCNDGFRPVSFLLEVLD